MEHSVPPSTRSKIISLAPFTPQLSHYQKDTLECLVPAPFIEGQHTLPTTRPRPWSLVRSRVGYGWQPSTNMETEVPSSFNNTESSLPLDEAFTEDEYNSLLKLEGWDYEETKYLMNLLFHCHYRFIIAADRYSYCENKGGDVVGGGREVTDIRERYYTVKKGLATKRNLPPPPAYSKEADRHHRLTLTATASQMSHELMTEGRILSELMSRLRICLPNVIREREALLINCCNGFSNNLYGQNPSFPELAGIRTATSRKNSSSGGSGNSEGSSNKSSKHLKNNNGSNKNRHGASNEAVATVSRKKKSNRSINNSNTNEGVEEVLPTGGGNGGPGRKPRPTMSNTLLASHSLKPIRVGLTRHIDKMMLDLGLPPHPDPPTEKVCQEYEELRGLLVKLAELQKSIASLGSSQSAGSLPRDATSRRSSRATSPPPPSTPIQGNISSPITQQKITEQTRVNAATHKRRRE